MRFLGIGKNRAQKELSRIMNGASVPSFPGMVMRVLEVLRDPDAEFSQIAERLQWDPALTFTVLKTVNSAAFGVSTPIQDVHHAVRFLGRSSLEQIVLGVAVRNSLPGAPAPGFDPKRFWAAAAFRALLAKRIATRLHPASEGECFTAGLLQDLALPVLAHGIPDRYGPILNDWHAGSAEHLHRLEQSALGWSHDEVGALICESWEMPKALIERIGAHHDDSASDQTLLPSLRLVSLIREALDEGHLTEFVEVAKSEYGLPSDQMMTLVREVQDESQELANTLTPGRAA